MPVPPSPLATRCRGIAWRPVQYTTDAPRRVTISSDRFAFSSRRNIEADFSPTAKTVFPPRRARFAVARRRSINKNAPYRSHVRPRGLRPSADTGAGGIGDPPRCVSVLRSPHDALPALASGCVSASCGSERYVGPRRLWFCPPAHSVLFRSRRRPSACWKLAPTNDTMVGTDQIARRLGRYFG